MADNQNAMEIPPVDQHNLALLQGVVTMLNGKGIHEHSFEEQRKLFHDYQQTPAHNPGVDVRPLKVKTSHGEVDAFLYKPKSCSDNAPFVYFVHGGGWILGSAADWEEFVFDLVTRANVAMVFPEYTFAPEKKYPAQQEQCIEVLQHVLSNGKEYGLNAEKVVLASDSVGAQLISAMSILNHERSLGFPIIHQIMLHPFVHTKTTDKVIEVPLTNIAWIEQYYEAYFGDTKNRSDILASPDLMTPEQAKQYMPPSTIITSEIDGLRDQGEEFARLLQNAGVPCGVLRAIGSLHDFEIFRQARDSPTADLVMTSVAGKLAKLLSA